MNACDHNHLTTAEVRWLPTGGDGNMIVCRGHYDKEIAYRKWHMKQYNSEWKLPAWESLRIYE